MWNPRNDRLTKRRGQHRIEEGLVECPANKTCAGEKKTIDSNETDVNTHVGATLHRFWLSWRKRAKMDGPLNFRTSNVYMRLCSETDDTQAGGDGGGERDSITNCAVSLKKKMAIALGCTVNDPRLGCCIVCRVNSPNLPGISGIVPTGCGDSIVRQPIISSLRSMVALKAELLFCVLLATIRIYKMRGLTDS